MPARCRNNQDLFLRTSVTAWTERPTGLSISLPSLYWWTCQVCFRGVNLRSNSHSNGNQVKIYIAWGSWLRKPVAHRYQPRPLESLEMRVQSPKPTELSYYYCSASQGKRLSGSFRPTSSLHSLQHGQQPGTAIAHGLHELLAGWCGVGDVSTDTK